MKKIGQLCREALEKNLTDYLKEDNNIFFVNYSGLSASKLSQLRSNLKQSGARLLVSKNTICGRVFDKIKLGQMKEFIKGPIGLILVGGDLVGVSKTLFNFKKETEKLDFLGGFWQARKIGQSELKELSLLPPKPILQAKLLGLIKSPIVNLVVVFNRTLSKLVLVLKAIKDKK